MVYTILYEVICCMVFFICNIIHIYAGFTECATYGVAGIHTTREYAIHTIDSMHYTPIESMKYCSM